MPDDNRLEKDFGRLRAEAVAHSRAGRYIEAIQAQIKIINGKVAAGLVANPKDHLRLGGYLFLTNNFAGAAATLSNAHKMFPDDMSILENLAVNLMNLARFQESIDVLLKVVAVSPNSGNVLDGLAHCHGKLGQMAEAKEAGEKAMRAKDALLPESKFKLPDKPIKPFGYGQSERNVISFSLFGTKPRYLNGAIRNATLQPDIYPDWSCRFYCDDKVPQDCLEKLRSLGCDIRMMRSVNPFDGLFWRFKVVNDPAVDRFLVRDCDAVINVRERVAVDEWLVSDAHFHLMRDFYSHTELILAGMWGGVGNVLPPINELLENFKISKLITNAIDQWFLRQMVWPIVRQSCLIHDSHFQVFGSRDFPKVGQLPPGKHVGQNESALVKSNVKTATPGPGKKHKNRVFKIRAKTDPDDILSGS